MRAMLEGGVILVADIGGTSIKLGAVRAGAALPVSARLASQVLRSAHPLAVLERMLRDFAHENGLFFDAVVLTIPGFIDTDFDVVLHAANLPQLNGVAVASGLGARLGVPVLLERDAVLLLQGERAAGSAMGCASVLGLFFGTGVGAALIEQGTVFRGAGWALEIGHMPVHGDGPALAGLQAECLEVHASGRRLDHLASQHGLPVEDIFTVGGSQALADDLQKFVRNQALAAASASLLFCPQSLLLGGGVLEMKGYPRARLVEQIAERASLPPGRALDIRFAARGWRAVLDGAAALVAARLSSSHASPSHRAQGADHAR